MSTDDRSDWARMYDDTDREPAPSRPATDAPALEAIVVSYENGPDRCTIAPRNATGIERMETWLTADRDVFVSACEWR